MPSWARFLGLLQQSGTSWGNATDVLSPSRALGALNWVAAGLLPAPGPRVWWLAAVRSSLPGFTPCASVIAWRLLSASLGLSLPLLLLMKAPSLDGATLIPKDLVLTASVNTFVPNTVRGRGLGGPEFWEGTIQPRPVPQRVAVGLTFHGTWVTSGDGGPCIFPLRCLPSSCFCLQVREAERLLSCMCLHYSSPEALGLCVCDGQLRLTPERKSYLG